MIFKLFAFGDHPRSLTPPIMGDVSGEHPSLHPPTHIHGGLMGASPQVSVMTTGSFIIYKVIGHLDQ